MSTGPTGIQGCFGTQGERGPQGVAGATGLVGPTGPKPYRGYPGDPFFKVRGQLLTNNSTVTAKVFNLSNGVYLSKVVRPFTTGVPALDASGNSSAISGMSVDASSGLITLQPGTYYAEGCSSLTSNTNFLGSCFSLSVDSNGTRDFVSGVQAYKNGTSTLNGFFVVDPGNQQSYALQTVVASADPGVSVQVTPTYNSNVYSSPPIVTPPPNVSIMIMKIL